MLYGDNFQVLSLPKKPQSDSEEEEEEKVGDGKRQTSLFSFFKRKPKAPETVCNKSQEPESVSLDVSVLKAVAEAEVSEVKTETFSHKNDQEKSQDAFSDIDRPRDPSWCED